MFRDRKINLYHLLNFGILTVLLTGMGCQSGPEPAVGTVPGWLESIPKDKSHYYAIGVSRPTPRVSDAWDQAIRRARAELGRVMISHVSSKNTILSSSSGGYVREVIRILSDPELSYTEVIERWADRSGAYGPPENFYVLVRIHKGKAESVLREFRVSERLFFEPSQEYPMFPWPPPQASAFAIIPSQFSRKSINEGVTLYDLERKIYHALDSSGYVEQSYYAVPGGFAIVTRLEQINPDGTPKEIPDRWATKVGPLRRFSLRAYLKALFTDNLGYYRVVVFIVTPHPFSQADKKVSDHEAAAWLRKGLVSLPREVSSRSFSDEYICTALIYEFEHPRHKEKAVIRIPGRLTGRTHLVKANLWNELEK